MPLKYSWHENQLLEDLGADIARGEIVIDENIRPFTEKLMAAFPVRSLRIDWPSVPEILHLASPAGRATADFELTEPATELRNFWERVRREYRIEDQTEVVVLGDSLVSFVLKLSVERFTAHLVHILSIPQHTYVFPHGLEWCFGYTFEDDAFFGLQPSRSERDGRARRGPISSE